MLSLLIKMLPIRITSEAIAGDPFKKKELPQIGFQVGTLGVFRPNFKASVRFTHPINLFKKRHVCVKTK